MALIFCTRCGHKVSTNAPKCPSCGAPPYQASAVPCGPTLAATGPASIAPQVPTWARPQMRGSSWAVQRALQMFVDEPKVLWVPAQALAVTVVLLVICTALGVGGLSLSLSGILALKSAGEIAIASMLATFVLWFVTCIFVAAGTWGCLVDLTEGCLDPAEFCSHGLHYFGRALTAVFETFLIGFMAGLAGLVWFWWPAVLVGMSPGFWLIWVVPGFAGCLVIYVWFTLRVLLLWPAVFLSNCADFGFEIVKQRRLDVLLLWVFLHIAGAVLLVVLSVVNAGTGSSVDVGIIEEALSLLTCLAFGTFCSLASLLYYRLIMAGVDPAVRTFALQSS